MTSKTSGLTILPRFTALDGMVDYITKDLDKDSAEAVLKTERSRLLPEKLVQPYEECRSWEINHIITSGPVWTICWG